jgi:hypothetical protein
MPHVLDALRLLTESVRHLIEGVDRLLVPAPVPEPVPVEVWRTEADSVPRLTLNGGE